MMVGTKDLAELEPHGCCGPVGLSVIETVLFIGSRDAILAGVRHSEDGEAAF
jgi:hypothetical protein